MYFLIYVTMFSIGCALPLVFLDRFQTILSKTIPPFKQFTSSRMSVIV
jgi:hypothetical protein